MHPLDDAALDACAAYVLDRAKYVIQTFGQRPPGSEAETRTQQLVQRELSEACDTPAELEPFPVAQKAFMGMQAVSGTLAVLATIGYWISPWLAVALSTSAIVVLYFQLLRYRRFLDPFFPWKTSHNVYAAQKPKGELRRRIILNAHPDAAYEWRWLYNYPRYFKFFVLCSLAALFLKWGSDLAFLIIGRGESPAQSTLGIAIGLMQLALAPGALIGILFNDFRHVSPGANDNLTGTFLVTGIAKFLKQAGWKPEHTEILYCVTGSEEAGLRGAKHFAARHKAALSDIETIVVALDTIRDLEHLHVYNRDLNGTVAHDPAVCKLLKDAGADCGLHLQYATVFLGSSDATAFTQAGYRAAALCAMDPAPADYYHNRRDDWNNMNPACIRKTAELVLAAILKYDREGLPAV